VNAPPTYAVSPSTSSALTDPSTAGKETGTPAEATEGSPSRARTVTKEAYLFNPREEYPVGGDSNQRV
jgi:hypothetical protein